MTEKEILEVLLNKVVSMDSKIESMDNKINSIDSRLTTVESNMAKLKRQMTRTTKELKTMDRMILDEIERVHSILIRHTQDKTVHTA